MGFGAFFRLKTKTVRVGGAAIKNSSYKIAQLPNAHRVQIALEIVLPERFRRCIIKFRSETVLNSKHDTGPAMTYDQHTKSDGKTLEKPTMNAPFHIHLC
jgi:hypothetical protein